MDFERYTVSEITEIISDLLTMPGKFFLIGEVSGVKYSSSGHIYFTLKDENACISAVIWKFRRNYMNFLPENGQKVVVNGSLKVYKPNGTYSVDCESIKDAGEGNILLMLEMRKKKYREAGYFDVEKKKEIPKNPRRIGIITSPTGAVLHDFLRVTGRRNNSIDIVILPAPVQGADAAWIISERIRQANRCRIADVLVIARGGGSIEDLLPFSEECLIQAVYDSEIPVVSAVGHETDWTLCDLVADLRAATPSVAGELVCEKKDDYISVLSFLYRNMLSDVRIKISEAESVLRESINVIRSNVEKRINSAKTEVDSSGIKYLVHNINSRIFSYNMEIDNLLAKTENSVKSRLSLMSEVLGSTEEQIKNNIKTFLERKESALNLYLTTLSAFNPQLILNKGYAVVSDMDGVTIKDAKQVSDNDILNVRLSKGKMIVKVVNNGRV